MQSFNEHRKKQLRSEMYCSSLREDFAIQFDVLRLDLLETIKLPDNVLFENNVTVKAEYKFLKKQDYKESSQLVEQIIRICKNNFYEKFIEEAGASLEQPVASSDMYDKFKSDLLSNAQKMIKDLKIQIKSLLGSQNSNHSTDNSSDADDSYDSQSSNSTNNGYVGSNHFGSPRASNGDNHSHGNNNYNWGSPVQTNAKPYLAPGTEFSADPLTGWKPAKYGNFLPADGVIAGTKRLLGNLISPTGLNIRQNWHAHPNRPMAKESVEQIGVFLIENEIEIMNLLDTFEKSMISYINNSVDQLLRVASGRLPRSANPSKNPIATNSEKTGSSGIVPSPGNVGMDDQEAEVAASEGQPEKAAYATGTSPRVFDKGKNEDPLAKAADAGDKKAQKIILKHYENLQAGCQFLGLSLSGIEPTWHRRTNNVKIKQKNFLIDGKPIEDLNTLGFAKYVYETIYKKIKKEDPKDRKGLSTKVRKFVNDTLGLTGKIPDSTNELNGVVLQVILQLGHAILSRHVDEQGNVTGPIQGLYKKIPNKYAAKSPISGETDPGATQDFDGEPQGIDGEPQVANSKSSDGSDWSSDPEEFAKNYKSIYPDEWEELNKDKNGNVDNKGLSRIAMLLTHKDSSVKDNPVETLNGLKKIIQKRRGTETPTDSPERGVPPLPGSASAKATQPLPGSASAKATQPLPGSASAKATQPLPGSASAKATQPLPGSASAKATQPLPGSASAKDEDIRNIIAKDYEDEGMKDIADYVRNIPADKLNNIIKGRSWSDNDQEIIDDMEAYIDELITANAKKLGEKDGSGIDTSKKELKRVNFNDLNPNLNKIKESLEKGKFGFLGDQVKQGIMKLEDLVKQLQVLYYKQFNDLLDNRTQIFIDDLKKVNVNLSDLFTINSQSESPTSAKQEAPKEVPQEAPKDFGLGGESKKIASKKGRPSKADKLLQANPTVATEYSPEQKRELEPEIQPEKRLSGDDFDPKMMKMRGKQAENYLINHKKWEELTDDLFIAIKESQRANEGKVDIKKCMEQRAAIIDKALLKIQNGSVTPQDIVNMINNYIIEKQKEIEGADDVDQVVFKNKDNKPEEPSNVKKSDVVSQKLDSEDQDSGVLPDDDSETKVNVKNPEEEFDQSQSAPKGILSPEEANKKQETERSKKATIKKILAKIREKSGAKAAKEIQDFIDKNGLDSADDILDAYMDDDDDEDFKRRGNKRKQKGRKKRFNPFEREDESRQNSFGNRLDQIIEGFFHKISEDKQKNSPSRNLIFI